MWWRRFLKWWNTRPATGDAAGETGFLQLHFSDGSEFHSPTCDQCAEGLRMLAEQPGQWMTLSRSPVDFVMVESTEAGFAVECECGSLDNHLRLLGPDLDVFATLDLLYAYTGRDSDWREAYEFARLPIPEIDLRRAPHSAHGAIRNDPQERQ